MPASAETPEPLVTPLSDAASPPGSMEEYFFDCRGYTILSGKLYSTPPPALRGSWSTRPQCGSHALRRRSLGGRAPADERLDRRPGGAHPHYHAYAPCHPAGLSLSLSVARCLLPGTDPVDYMPIEPSLSLEGMHVQSYHNGKRNDASLVDSEVDDGINLQFPSAARPLNILRCHPC